MPFIPVIDPNITQMNEVILRAHGSTVIKVTERDDTGGFVGREICDMPPDSTAPNTLRLSTANLAAFSFISGFHVMALEMCAFRVLQTTFGSSIHVTGTLLTLIMMALAVGYYLGGIRAHRRGVADLPRWVLAACVWILLVDIALRGPLLDWAFEWRRGIPGTDKTSILPVIAATLALFAVPMTAFGTTTPFLISHLASRNDAHAGLIAGRLMALSTFGSILGTLAGSFVLVPHLGITPTLIALNVSALAMIAWRYLPARRIAAATAVLAALSLAGGVIERTSVADAHVVFETESRYGSIRVEELRGDERRSWVYKPNRIYWHSQYFPDSPLDAQFPIGYFGLGPLFGHRRYLVLGVAGGTVLTQLAMVDPSYELTGVEIDEASIDVARRFFGVPPSVQIIADDARMFLAAKHERYDFILVDLFAGDFIPPHCATTEFFRLVREHLSPGGVAVINSNMIELWAVPDEVEDFPGQHLHAALFQAGFKDLYANDMHDEGFIYAFPDGMEEGELLERLRTAARAETWDVRLRASWAATAIRVVKIPPSRATARPFSDQWIPEVLLQKHDNYDARIAAVEVDALPEAGERSIARCYVEVAKALAEGDAREPTRRYCDAIARVISGDRGDKREIVARYLMPWCSDQPGHTELIALTRGLDLLNRDRGAEALPELLRGLDALF